MVESLVEKKEYIMIDYFRILCAVGVVAIHLNPLSDVNEYAEFFLGNVLTRVCVPFFFMTTGFFLANKINDWSKVKKYLVHILRLYLVYSLIYFPQVVWSFTNDGKSFAHNALFYCKNFVLVGSYLHLWYFVASVVATLLLYYVVNKLCINDKGIIIITFSIYCVGVLGNAYFNNWMKNQEDNIIWLYCKLFTTTRNGVFFGFPFVTMGYLVAKYKQLFKKRNYCLFSMAYFALMTIETLIIHRYFNVNEVDMTFGLVPTVMCLFLLIAFVKCENDNCRSIANHLRKLSLLVFGFHMFVDFYCGKFLLLCGITHSLIVFIIILIVTLMISEAVLFLVDKRQCRFFELFM